MTHLPHSGFVLQSAIKGQLYYLLRRCLSQDTRDQAKEWARAMRNRFARFLPLIYGHYSARDLVQNLNSGIVEEFDILMVHSSYDHLLPVYSGRPQDIVNELIAYCGPNRTLVMPAFFLGGRHRDKKSYYKAHAFDVKRNASEMGLLTEIFRRMPGVKRSLHPTHSICALGPLAEELTATHHLASTRTGHGTPFEVMARKRCVIAGLGVEYFRVLTQTHTAEDMLGEEFPVEFGKETFPVSMIDGKGNKVSYELCVLSPPKTLDNTLLRSLLRKGELREWKFKGAQLFVTFPDKVTDRLIDAAKQGLTVYGSFAPRTAKAEKSNAVTFQ